MFKNSVVVTIGAAVLVCFVQQPWWLRGIEGAALGFTTFVTIPALYTWAKNRVENVDITVHCSPAVMPTKLPAGGGFSTVMLYPGGGGSVVAYGDAGEQTSWPANTPAFKCEARNLSGKVLPAIRITLPIEYRNGDGSELAEEGKRTGRISIIAPRMGARVDQPFVFYVYNPGGFGATVKQIEVSYHDEQADQSPIRIRSNILFPIAFGMAPHDG